jgi:putative restriction endonuclease
VLPPLLRKAAGDAGFDLVLGEDAEWTRLGVSGLDGVVWVLPARAGAVLALPAAPPAGELELVTWTDVPLPPGAAVAVRCDRPDALMKALRRVRVLRAQTPPRPEQRFQARLAAVSTTEREAVVRQRVGQSLFREMMLEYWEGRCAVTGLDVPELLRASHAKPWAASSDAERLDVYNGFLLAVHLDALFDGGWMTFDEEGRAVFSPALSEGAVKLLLRHGRVQLSRVTGGHEPYLAYHRRHVFRE